MKIAVQLGPASGTPPEVAYKWDKDYPLKFYSRELLSSDAARAEFVPPDLAVPDFSELA